MESDQVLGLMNEVLEQQGKQPVVDLTMPLREIGFRSLDFSELALRVEDEIGTEINFDAAKLRAINTPADVVGFFAGIK